MGEIADASAQREEHAGKERHLHRTTASTTVIGHLQQEGSDKACVDAAVAQFVYATGTTF